jgi:hypothetical protein
MNTETTPKPSFPDARAQKLSKRKAIWLTALFGTIAFALGGGVIGGLAGYHEAKSGVAFGEGALPIVLIAVCLIAAFVSMWWSVGYWKTIDEMARRAHLDSWFWGGTLGSIPLGVLGIGALLMPSLKIDIIERLALTSTQVFGLGAIAIYGCMLLGYTIFWFVWWAQKR